MNFQLAENLDVLSVSIKTSQPDISPLQPQASITVSSPVFKASYHEWAGSTEIQIIYMERKKIPCLHSRPDSALHFHTPSVARLGVHLWWGLSLSPCRWGHATTHVPKAGAPGCARGTVPGSITQNPGNVSLVLLSWATQPTNVLFL